MKLKPRKKKCSIHLQTSLMKQTEHKHVKNRKKKVASSSTAKQTDNSFASADNLWLGS